MLEVHVIYIYVQYILIDLVKLWKDSANSSNKDSELRNYRYEYTGISGLESCTISMPVKQRSVMGPVSWKLQKRFGPIKLFLVYLYLKMEKCVCPKRLQSIKGTSVHFKNMWIKQLCNHTLRDFDMALRVRKKCFWDLWEKGPWVVTKLQIFGVT